MPLTVTALVPAESEPFKAWTELCLRQPKAVAKALCVRRVETTVPLFDLDSIIHATAFRARVPVPEVLGKIRTHNLTRCRAVIVLLARKWTWHSFPGIADRLGYSSHTSAVTQSQKYRAKSCPDTVRLILDVEDLLVSEALKDGQLTPPRFRLVRNAPILKLQES